MLNLKTDLFRKNFLFCKLMYKDSKSKENIASLSKNYREADKEAFKQQLILKLAFIELSGWIESALDEIYISIGTTNIEKELIERHIKYNNGFKEKNITSCLRYCLGDLRYGKLKKIYIGSSDKTIFFKKLEDLAEYRNEYAHTCLDAGALPGGQPGMQQIQSDFLFLLKNLIALQNNLNTI